MTSAMHATTPPHEELLRVIRAVRNRWRARLALRGLAIALGGALALLLVAAYGMEYFRFSEASILAFRVIVYVAVVALVLRFLVLPLTRQVSDERVALYVEEHEPSLQAAVLSAVEHAKGGGAESARSAALVKRLIDLAVMRAREIQFGRRIEQRGLRRTAAVLAGAAAAAAVLVAVGPQFLRHGGRVLLLPWRTAAAATPYRIAVVPGHATVPRGGDQKVVATLSGFGAEQVELAVKRGPDGAWERLPMGVGTKASEYVLRLFDLDRQTDYYVDAGGVRSPLFRLNVADLPSVERVDLEYRFPAYTGLAPETVENGGDIAALRGTTVIVRAKPTMPVRGGRILIEGGRAVPLVVGEDGQLAGTLKVDRPGFYNIELQSPKGDTVVGSLDYTIDTLPDQPPSLTIVKPGRDTKVTAVEEVFAEARAEDDYGVQRVELIYSVNGGPERRVTLHDGGKRRSKEVSAGHTLFLEELGLQPGDLISYYARATDNDNVGGPKSATTDIYFLDVRPFDREYRQAEQGGGGGRGGGSNPGALTARQREIIAATFKTARDRRAHGDGEYRENVATLVLSQGRLREQVETLAQRLQMRGAVSMDSTFRLIGEELPKAASEMRAAEEVLGKRDAKGALAPEQRALQHLQRAEAAFRQVQVSFGDAAGGGGGGSESQAEDLADLFELETDKLRNQYETVNRGGQEASDNQVDETLERLRKLAARQQQETERLRRRAEGMRASGGDGGGNSQRELAQEAEEMARRLERLAREQSPNEQSANELRETARRLQEAANAMRRSATGARDGGVAEGTAALERLEDARRLLDKSRSSRLERDARQALESAEQLAEEQKKIADDVGQLPSSGAGRAQREERLGQRKDALADRVAELEQRLDRASREGRREQREAARKLDEAAHSIRDNKVQEKVRFSKGVMRSGSPEYARSFEEQIGSNIDEVRQKVRDAVGAIGQSGEQKGEATLRRTRELVRGLESLEERTRQQREAESGPGGQRSREQSQSSRQGQQQGQQQGEQSGQARSGEQQGGRSQRGSEGNVAQRGLQGEPQPGGNAVRSGGDPYGRPGGFTSEEVRQYTREYRDRRAAAEALRREIARSGEGAADLDRLIARLRELEGARAYDDPEELARLQTAVIQGFKAFEFALWRRLGENEQDKPRVGGSGDVPPGFKQLVEEYYRSLAKKGAK